MKYKRFICICEKLILMLLVCSMTFCCGCSLDSMVKKIANGITQETEEKTFEEITQDLPYLKDYYDLIEKYEKKYGALKRDKEFDYLLYGLCYAELVDFNNDGMQELVLAYGKKNQNLVNYQYEVWTYSKGEVVQAGVETPVCYDGNTCNIEISEFNGQKYMISGGGDLSVQYKVYKFDGQAMKKTIEFRSAFNDGDTKYYMDDVEVTEREYDRTINGYWLDLKIIELYDISENREGVRENRELIANTKRQCKNCQLDVIQNENKKQALEVTEYFSKWDDLIPDLKMELTDGREIMESGTAYSFGYFYLENNELQYYIRNDADNEITLYGISIGDSIEKLNDFMTDNGWEVFYEYDKVHDYIRLDETGDYFARIESDSTGKIRFWEIYNYAPAQLGWTFKQMRIERLTGWQRQYYDYLEEVSENHSTDGLEVQYIYLDDDRIPEMLINYSSLAEGGELCYMSGTEMKVQNVGSYGVSYIERTGIFSNSGGHMDAYYNEVYKLENETMTIVGKGVYEAGDNSNVQFDEAGNPIYEYYWNDKLVSQEKYDNSYSQAFHEEESKSPYGEMMTIWEAQEKLLTME